MGFNEPHPLPERPIMTNPTPHGQVPEALRLANVCSNLARYSMDAHLIAAELRRLHAENEALRTQQPASPTPPAEQQAQPGAVDRTGCTAGTDEECTRRGCATSCPSQQAAPKAAPVSACVCGEPQASGTVHRVDGPCYVAAPQPATLSDDVVKDAARYRWLFGARTPSQVTSVQETVFKPLPQDEVLGHLQGFYMSKADVDTLVDAALAAQGGKA